MDEATEGSAKMIRLERRARECKAKIDELKENFTAFETKNSGMESNSYLK